MNETQCTSIKVGFFIYFLLYIFFFFFLFLSNCDSVMFKNTNERRKSKPFVVIPLVMLDCLLPVIY